jgi:hypothetical protein
MNTFTSLELAELRQHQLRVDAARARLAAQARRARRQRSSLAWLRRIASRRPRYSRTPSAKPAPVTPVTPMARSRPFDDLALRLASDGPAATHDDLSRFVTSAAARGASPTLLSVLADSDQPEVTRQRAFGRIAVELATQMPDSAQHRPDRSDAA